MSGRSSRNRFGAALVAVAAIGVAVRVGFLMVAASPLPDPGDAIAYHLLADGLADGDGYVRPFDRTAGRTIPTAEWAPVFPSVLAVLDVVGFDTVDEQRYGASCLAGLGIVLTGWAGTRVGGGRVGLTGAALVALHPLLVQNDTALLTEGLALAGGAAVLVASLRLRTSASLRDAALTGAAVGFAALVRADALALVPLLLVPLCLVAGIGGKARWIGAFRLMGVSLGAVLLVVGPWAIRNAVRLDRFVGISTNAATAVAGANCEVTYVGDVVGYWRFGPGCFLGYDTGDLVERGEASVAANHLGEGVDYARAHRGRLPAVVVARVLRLWGAWDVDEQASLAALDEAKSPSWIRAGTWVGWAITALAAVSLFVLLRRRAWAALLALGVPLIAVTVAAAVTYGNARFRAGAEPALAVLAASFLFRSWRTA